MMDIAWVHFNHLRDKYAADGILRTIPEWVELLCVPSGWDGEPLLQSGRGGPDPLEVLGFLLFNFLWFISYRLNHPDFLR